MYGFILIGLGRLLFLFIQVGGKVFILVCFGGFLVTYQRYIRDGDTLDAYEDYQPNAIDKEVPCQALDQSSSGEMPTLVRLLKEDCCPQ